MKKISFIALSSLILGLAACKVSQEKLLCKTWRVAEVDFSDKLVAEPWQKPLIVQQLKDSMIVVFGKDKTYHLYRPGGNEVGSWELNKKTNTLYVRTQHSGSTNKISILTENKMEVNVKDESGVDLQLTLTPYK